MILTYFSLAVNIVLSILYTPVMLRILGQSEHGLYSTVSSAMSWLSLLGLGIGSSYIYFFARYNAKNDDDAIASLNGLFLIIFCIIGLICLFCGLVISDHLRLLFADGMTDAEYVTARRMARIVTIDMAIGFPASVFSAIIRANERYIQSKLAALFQNVFTPLLTLPLLLSGHGSVGMVAATTIVDFIAYTFNAVYCFRRLHIKVRFRRFAPGIIAEIFSYSAFIALNSLIGKFATGLDKIIITRYVHTAAASVYAIGCSLYNYYSAFAGAVSGVFSARIQKITAAFRQDQEQLRTRLTQQFIRLGRIQFLIQMLMLTGILFFGKEFIHLWAERGGQDYSRSYPIALLLCAANTVPLIQSIGREIQRAQNMHRYRTLYYGVMTALNVVLTVILCKRYGEIGAAVGTALSSLVVDVVLMNVFYHKKLNVDIIAYWKEILGLSKGLVLPIAFGAACALWLPDAAVPGFLCKILGFTAVYCLSMYRWAMNQTEKEMCFGWAKKLFSGKPAPKP